MNMLVLTCHVQTNAHSRYDLHTSLVHGAGVMTHQRLRECVDGAFVVSQEKLKLRGKERVALARG